MHFSKVFGRMAGPRRPQRGRSTRLMPLCARLLAVSRPNSKGCCAPATSFSNTNSQGLCLLCCRMSWMVNMCVIIANTDLHVH